MPPDYEELSAEGQRLARINACSLQVTPDDFVTAWSFFRRTYLFPQGIELGFYGTDLTESPQFHYDFIWDIAKYAFNARACPRGFGKSTLVDELSVMIALTRPTFPTGLCLASDALINDRFELYQKQFEANDRIIADFGEMRPARGSGAWNLHSLGLNNGSRIRGFAVLGRKRGIKPRPRLLFLDDPEYDPSGSTDMMKVRADFDWLLFQVILPMGQKDFSICWPGTIITKQGSLWKTLTSDDPRFARWNRVILAAEMPDDKGDLKPIWPQLWDEQALKDRKQDLGPAAYAAEMMNRPGAGTGSTFVLDVERHGYTLEGDPGLTPLTSTAVVRYRERPKKSDEMAERTGAWGEMVAGMYRMAMVDYAPTVSPHSDYSAVVVVGFQRPQDVLWLLDVFVAKVRDDALIRTIWSMGQKWKVSVVGVESVSVQMKLVDSVGLFMEEMSAAGHWAPRVMPIKKPYGMSKQDGIGGMQWRFTSDRIRLPFYLENQKYWSMLFQQMRDFQAEARDGNLENDDAADALSMYQLMARRRGSHVPGDEPRSISGPKDSLAAGETDYMHTGMNPLFGVNAEEIGREILQVLAKRAEADQPRQKNLGSRTLARRDK